MDQHIEMKISSINFQLMRRLQMAGRKVRESMRAALMEDANRITLYCRRG